MSTKNEKREIIELLNSIEPDFDKMKSDLNIIHDLFNFSIVGALYISTIPLNIDDITTECRISRKNMHRITDRIVFLEKNGLVTPVGNDENGKCLYTLTVKCRSYFNVLESKT